MSNDFEFTTPGTNEVLMTRHFGVSRNILFAVMTDPAEIPNWWGPRDYPVVVDKMEVRPGGAWRYVSHTPDGVEHSFHGYYHLLDAPERCVFTFEYEGAPGRVLLQENTLSDIEGNTLLTTRVVYLDASDRTQMVSSGMEWGIRQSMERLDELVVVHTAH